MTVYRRTYAPYTGALTPAWSRWLVLFRYARRNLFRSKLLTAFFVACFFYPVLCLGGIYLAHNLSFLEQIGARGNIPVIDNRFFYYFTLVQGWVAFILTAFAGPGLISGDLANGALPLYFCRPFSRSEYVLGKASVLGILLSEITWVPGLVLFIVQATLAGPSWAWDHLWIAGSLMLSSLIWISILSLLAMALSAWVKWRIVAGALLLAMLFFGMGLAAAINAVLRTEYGHFVNLAHLLNSLSSTLFRMDVEPSISASAAGIAIVAYGAICLILLLKKVRAYEVIR
jgi:ABC-2 type transport system permease protein